MWRRYRRLPSDVEPQGSSDDCSFFDLHYSSEHQHQQPERRQHPKQQQQQLQQQPIPQPPLPQPPLKPLQQPLQEQSLSQPPQQPLTRPPLKPLQELLQQQPLPQPPKQPLPLPHWKPLQQPLWKTTWKPPQQQEQHQEQPQEQHQEQHQEQLQEHHQEQLQEQQQDQQEQQQQQQAEPPPTQEKQQHPKRGIMKRNGDDKAIEYTSFEDNPQGDTDTTDDETDDQGWSAEENSPPRKNKTRTPRRQPMHDLDETLLTSCFQLLATLDFLGGGDNEDDRTVQTSSSDDPPDDLVVDAEDMVMVAVEAIAICDVSLKKKKKKNSRGLSRVLRGTHFVGVVQEHNPYAADMGIERRARVAGLLIPQDPRIRQAEVRAKKLWMVPAHLDASDVLGVVSTFLPAFMALHHGTSRPHRYSPTCLTGRSVLIAGCNSLEAQAAVRMAHYAGASKVYVTASPEYFEPLKKQQTNLLEGKYVDDWLPSVEGAMDVVLDYSFPRQFWAVRKAVAPGGRLTCFSRSSNPMEHFSEVCYLASMKRATLFSFSDATTEEVEQDLEFFWGLLEKKDISPEIDRVVSWKELRALDVAKRPLSGSIICDPWRL